MDQFHLMKVFVVVVEEGGLAAASRRLSISAPAVTRAIAALEEALGIKLLQRTTRYVRATEAGTRYFEDARRILRDVELANEAAIGINTEPRGHLSVTAPVLFGQKFVLPGIVDYLARYQDTQVDAVFVDRVVNLLDEGFDVAIRIGDLPDSSMRARHVGDVAMVLVASPEYLKTAGIPQHPEDLKEHATIASSSNNLTQTWSYSDNNKKHKVRIEPRLRVTTNQAAIDAAALGLGITRVLSYQVADYLKSNQLKTVLEPFRLSPLPVHIVHREDRLSSRKVRAFIDLMHDKLAKDLNF